MPPPASPVVLRALLLHLLASPSAAANVFSGGQAPPPSPKARAGWCPTWTCCKTCDTPECKDCGATRSCQGEAAPTAAAPSAAAPTAATAIASAVARATLLPPLLSSLPSSHTRARTPQEAEPEVAPGFQSMDGKLYANGQPFSVKGINWFGSETEMTVPGGLRERRMGELLDFVRDSGFNALRIHVNHHFVLVNRQLNAGGFDEGLNPELVNLRYLEMLEHLIREAGKRKLLVMVVVHRTTATAWPGDGLWYDKDVSEEDARVVDEARHHVAGGGTLAADLVNEPVHATWGRNKPIDWNKAAERLGDTVLSACPLLVFVQGSAASRARRATAASPRATSGARTSSARRRRRCSCPT